MRRLLKRIFDRLFRPCEPEPSPIGEILETIETDDGLVVVAKISDKEFKKYFRDDDQMSIGYAAKYNEPDAFGDVFAPGAFKKKGDK